MADKTLAIYDIAKKEDFLTVVSPEEIVNVAALFSVDRLQSSEYVFANGTSVEDIEDAIPSQATLTVTDGETRFADIVWDMDSVNYDPKQKEEQSFRVNGVIELPDDIKNINNSALNVRVNVVVGAVFAEMQKISVSPAKTTVDYGKSVKFTAKAAEAEAYQWAKDDGEGNFGLIEGATTSVYTIKNAKGSDAGSRRGAKRQPSSS